MMIRLNRETRQKGNYQSDAFPFHTTVRSQRSHINSGIFRNGSSSSGTTDHFFFFFFSYWGKTFNSSPRCCRLPSASLGPSVRPHRNIKNYFHFCNLQSHEWKLKRCLQVFSHILGVQSRKKKRKGGRQAHSNRT